MSCLCCSSFFKKKHFKKKAFGMLRRAVRRCGALWGPVCTTFCAEGQYLGSGVEAHT